MSQPVLPDVQTAYNNLFTAVHQQVFFNKCAAAGYYPRTAEEAQWMLETAGKLRFVEEEVATKQAMDQGNQVSPYFAANSMLDHFMEQYGLGGNVKQAREVDHDMACRQAAVALCQDPTLYNSVLSLKAAEAAQIQAHLEQARRQAA